MYQNYVELIRDIGENEFLSRFAELQKQIDEFLISSHYISQSEDIEDNVECNDRILYHVLLDYYADIQRLKEFHEIKHTKTDKNIAYLAYWILKRKPIQINNLVEEDKDIFINERFVCYIVT